MQRWSAPFWWCVYRLGWRPRSHVPRLAKLPELRGGRTKETPQVLAADRDSGRGHPSDRRAATRHPSDLGTACRRIAGAKDELWQASVRNVSSSGVGLVMDRRFEPGTILAFLLDRPEQDFSRTVLGRVVHSTPQATGKWLIGCIIATELSDDELHAFRARRQPAEESNGRAWVRFPCNGDVPYQALVDLGGEQWSAKILDIAPGGVGLLLPLLVEQGAVLSVELQVPGQASRRTLQARVAHVTQQTEGWLTGCAFLDHLNDNELRTLLA